MGIAEEIKVKRFRNEWHEATVNIVYTSNWITKELERRANKKSITLQQFNVLRILRGQYPNSATNLLIKERMITDSADISRLIDRLVIKELVEKNKSKIDKRSVNVTITEKGLSLLDDIENDMTLMDFLPQQITEEEAKTLSILLDKLRKDVDHP